MQTRPNSSVIATLLGDPTNPLPEFTLVDVGASGGIAEYWSAFGDRLRATGFDPLIANMQKMSATENRPHVRYESAFVGCGNDPRRPTNAAPPFRGDPYARSSSVRAQEVKRLDYTSEKFNDGAPSIRTDRHITLDDYFADAPGLDFLKVDTDGGDLEVLMGSERLFADGEFLGVLVEAPFQGRLHEYANTFANVNRYLAARGFVLYDCDCFRYSRAALPRPFLYDIPAQTTSGQMYLSDALYFRDLAQPEYADDWKYEVTRERVLKLVALFDLFELQDCAAELLLARPGLTSPAMRTRLLDLLVVSAGFSGTYQEHVAGFDAHVEGFYASGRSSPPTPVEPPSPPTPVEPLPVTEPPVRRQSLLRRVRRRLLGGGSAGATS